MLFTKTELNRQKWINHSSVQPAKKSFPFHLSTRQVTNGISRQVKSCSHTAVYAVSILSRHLSHGEVICEDQPEMNLLLNTLFTCYPNRCTVFPWKSGKSNFEVSAVSPQCNLEFVSVITTKCFCVINVTENKKKKWWNTDFTLYVKF